MALSDASSFDLTSSTVFVLPQASLFTLSSFQFNHTLCHTPCVTHLSHLVTHLCHLTFGPLAHLERLKGVPGIQGNSSGIPGNSSGISGSSPGTPERDSSSLLACTKRRPAPEQVTKHKGRSVGRESEKGERAGLHGLVSTA